MYWTKKDWKEFRDFKMKENLETASLRNPVRNEKNHQKALLPSSFRIYKDERIDVSFAPFGLDKPSRKTGSRKCQRCQCPKFEHWHLWHLPYFEIWRLKHVCRNERLDLSLCWNRSRVFSWTCYLLGTSRSISE